MWSEALRRKKNSIISSDILVRRIIENEDEIVLVGIILQEILSGISNQKLFSDIKDILSDFTYLELSRNDYIYAAELRNKCKIKGIVAGSFDFLIASVAIRNSLTLVTYDNDFYNISKSSGLKILNIEHYLNIKYW